MNRDSALKAERKKKHNIHSTVLSIISLGFIEARESGKKARDNTHRERRTTTAQEPRTEEK